MAFRPSERWRQRFFIGHRAGFLILPALCLTFTAHADAERGRLLYENHCQACHESVVHVREKRAVQSLEGLMVQIERWQNELELNWNAQDRDDVQQFLNQRFYDFGATDEG